MTTKCRHDGSSGHSEWPPSDQRLTTVNRHRTSIRRLYQTLVKTGGRRLIGFSRHSPGGVVVGLIRSRIR